jgi:D-alanyl-D-alanine carboxypeptidase
MVKNASSKEIRSRLEGLLLETAKRKPLRHAVMAVECLHGSWRWSGAVGQASPEGAAMGPETPWFIASIDKLLHAVLVLRLCEQDRLHLETSIADLLPADLVRGLHCLGGRDYAPLITVRHLLSHTSGLADWLEEYPRGEPSVAERIFTEGDRAIGFAEIADYVRLKLQPHFPPQDRDELRPRVRYSDTNFILLIAIIESVTRRPLHEVLHDHFFQPLGMRHTFLPGFSRPQEGTPAGATLGAAGRPLDIPQLTTSFRGIYSTTGDMLLFLRSLLRGDGSSPAASWSIMQQRWNRFGFPRDRAALRAPGWPIEYGLGLMRFRLPRIFTPVQAMPAVLGHTGSTGCWIFYCPAHELLLCGNVSEVTAGALPFRLVPKLLRICAAAAW